MENPVKPSNKKQFVCCHCNGTIVVPRDLPPTTAPCPYCGTTITSPGDERQTTANTADSGTPPLAPSRSSRPPPPPPPPAQPPPQAAYHAPTPVATSLALAAEKPVERAAQANGPASSLSSSPVAKAPASSAVPHAHSEKSHSRFPQFRVLALLLLCIVFGGLLAFIIMREMRGKVAPASGENAAAALLAQDANYLRVGWQKDAWRVLQGFLYARTSADKLPHIIGGDQMAPRLEKFYGTSAIDDSDTPAASFSVYDLSEEDRKRGLFMMTYDQPSQFDMREFFRPLATLEVQHGLEEADLLLTTMARAANFSMEPLRVHAFFKRTPEGLKLDWEIFAQTKYRTFQRFVELPEPGQTAVFRVFIVEDVQDARQGGKGSRTYRLSDPANVNDAARILVEEDSDVGRALAAINWRGTKDIRPLTRTATVELAWSRDKDTPQLQINRFVCWEFLGLGGEDHESAASKN